jgi:hypothetical protein
MNIKEHTKCFPEVDNLLKQRKKLKNKLNKISRKLKSLENKYKFLQTIIGIDVSDDILENSLKLYFKEVGFQKVEKVGKQFRKEDLRIIQSDRTLLIETTGIDKANPKDNKTRQITKHIGIRKKNGENVFGLFVLHYEKQKNVNNRIKNPFTKDQIKYANADNYGLVTTIELFKAFKLLKNKTLSFEEFNKKIHSSGYITF